MQLARLVLGKPATSRLHARGACESEELCRGVRHMRASMASCRAGVRSTCASPLRTRALNEILPVGSLHDNFWGSAFLAGQDKRMPTRQMLVSNLCYIFVIPGSAVRVFACLYTVQACPWHVLTGPKVRWSVCESGFSALYQRGPLLHRRLQCVQPRPYAA